MIKVLELFSGTRSIGKCCDKLGWESVSVDMIFPATHKCDIMHFDYKQYPVESKQEIITCQPKVEMSPFLPDRDVPFFEEGKLRACLVLPCRKASPWMIRSRLPLCSFVLFF